MNIKEHIESGHYERDSDGRALVPMKEGRVVTILSHNLPNGYGGPSDYPICGFHERWDGVERWDSDGYQRVTTKYDREPFRLLPPLPRKVKVKAWGVFYGSTMQGSANSEQVALNMARDWEINWKQKPVVIELTGSYEEPW